MPSSCNGGAGTSGQQLHTYTGILALPTGCTDWNLTYTGCCRSTATTNLVSPATQPIFIRAQLNNALPVCNNSPVFITDAQMHGCVGQVNKFQSYAFDPDGDSLVYSLIDARQSASTIANYVGGFSGTNPFTSPVSINNLTGEITFTPAVPQIGVLTFLIREYRNGVQIGTVMREL